MRRDSLDEIAGGAAERRCQGQDGVHAGGIDVAHTLLVLLDAAGRHLGERPELIAREACGLNRRSEDAHRVFIAIRLNPRKRLWRYNERPVLLKAGF